MGVTPDAILRLLDELEANRRATKARALPVLAIELGYGRTASVHQISREGVWFCYQNRCRVSS